MFGKEQKPGGGDWEGYTDAGGSPAYRRKPGMQIVLLRSLGIPKVRPPTPTTTPISRPSWEPAWNLFLELKGLPLQGDSVILRAQSLQPPRPAPPTDSVRQVWSAHKHSIPLSKSPGPGRGGLALVPGLLTPKLGPSGHQSPPPPPNRRRALGSGLTHVLSITF